MESQEPARVILPDLATTEIFNNSKESPTVRDQGIKV